MIYQDLKKFELPKKPGVYMFLAKNRDIIYVGKATSLADRVRSYFNGNLMETRGPLIDKMVEEATGIKFIETDSVLEAVILEASLIKKQRPTYNTKEKDDKSFNYVIVTNDDFPKVALMRARELCALEDKKKVLYSFGPYPQGGLLKEALKIVRKIFPYSDNKCIALSGKSCFNRQIGLCPGVCTREISKTEYRKQIRNIKMFFEGKKKELIKKLEKEMKEMAKKQEFEKANKTKRTIFALNHIHDVSLIKRDFSGGDDSGETNRIEAYDLAHMSGKNYVGVMIVVENGNVKKGDYRKFKIRTIESSNDTGALREILERRFNHPEWAVPNIIVVDGGKAQINTANATIKEAGFNIEVVSVVKDEFHRPRQVLGNSKLVHKFEKEILLANSEAHRFAILYHRQLRDKIK